MSIVVIGGGPAGRTAAMQAAGLGEEVTLIEKEHIGGKCLNEGCMVICGLNDLAKFWIDAQKFTERGIISPCKDLNYSQAAQEIKNTISKIRHILEKETEYTGVKIVSGEASIKDDQVVVNDEKYPYQKLILATGSKPYIPPIEGVKHASTYKDILNWKEIPEKLLIIGSGVIATELASIYACLGSEVHLFARRSFLSNFETEIREYILEKLLKGVIVHENSSVEEIQNKGLYSQGEYYEGSVLLATGLTPNSKLADEIVEIGDKGQVIVDQRMQTSDPNIYAAGDLIGGIGTTPVARMEGVVAARNACGLSAHMKYEYIPSAISLYYDVSYFTNYQEGGVTGSIPGSGGPGSFWNVLEGNTGITQLKVKPESGEICNVTSISPSSRTSIAYLSLMIRDSYKTHDFDEFLETHPSTDAIYKLLRYFASFG